MQPAPPPPSWLLRPVAPTGVRVNYWGKGVEAVESHGIGIALKMRKDVVFTHSLLRNPLGQKERELRLIGTKE